MKQISIDALNMQIFETIEMLKNNSDSEASDNEKIDVDTAKAIASLAKVVVDGYKVKAHVLAMLKTADNPEAVKEILLNHSGGIFNNNKKEKELSDGTESGNQSV